MINDTRLGASDPENSSKVMHKVRLAQYREKDQSVDPWNDIAIGEYDVFHKNCICLVEVISQ